MASYDKLDWHLDAAVAAGRLEENAFTHIGIYLAWLIRNNLHDPESFPSSARRSPWNPERSGKCGKSPDAP